MVNHHDRLNRTFWALVDPTRRAMLAQLERKEGASISELAEPFAIKLPAVMKHLDVLADAGLVTRSKAGRTVTVRLRAQPGGGFTVLGGVFQDNPPGGPFDADGQLYVAASLGGRRGVVRFDHDRNPELFLSGPGIVGLAFTPSRAMAITSSDAIGR